MGPLDGIRILDLTWVLMGPYATSILGDMGADVIKVESPAGDIVRQIGPSRSGEVGGMFMHASRSKRSLVLDLKTAAGLRIALQLAVRSDVLISNLRPKAMARLGLRYEVVAAPIRRSSTSEPSASGSPALTPDAPPTDDLIQGASGIPALMAERRGGRAPLRADQHRRPHRRPSRGDRDPGRPAPSDPAPAKGRRSTCPCSRTMTSLVLGDHLGGLSYEPLLDGGGYARVLSRHRSPFRTTDARLCVVLYTDRHFRAFFDLAGRGDRLDDPRFATHLAAASATSTRSWPRSPGCWPSVQRPNGRSCWSAPTFLTCP